MAAMGKDPEVLRECTAINKEFNQTEMGRLESLAGALASSKGKGLSFAEIRKAAQAATKKKYHLG